MELRSVTSVAIHAASIFDGSAMGGPATVYVTGGKVTDVDRTGRPAPGGVDAIDLGPDSCLLPGLIDCHVHLAFDATEDPVGTVRSSGDVQLLAGMRAAARAAVRADITTVRDLGDRGYLAVSLAREIEADPAIGPEILAAGPPLTTPGGHCFFLGGEVECADGLRAAVRERFAGAQSSR
jgi:imidazolonepropionase-like amidohydrolase